MENFEKLVKSRQSCRDYTDQVVEKEKLDKIMEIARLTPSACNSQPWTMMCASNNQTATEIKACLQLQGHNKFLDNVTSFIAIVENNAVLKPNVESKFDRNRFVKYDVGELTAYLTLAAKAIGLETCILGWMDEARLAAALGLTENQICRMVVAVGYSNSPVREKVRKDREITIKYL